MPRATILRVGMLALVTLALLALLTSTLAQERRPVVYVAPVEGIIDLGLAPFVKRVLDEATAVGAVAVVLNINTFGGRVDAAVQIRDALLNARVRTIAFVNKRAISAGALIALAAQDLVMAEGGTIGAATPVQLGQPGEKAEAVGEKTVSYVRKEFRATAESRKRPPLLAEAMVDADVVVRGITEKGKLLTLTTDEALKHKLAEQRADTIESALDKLGLGTPELHRAAPNWAENVVRFLTHPVVSSLLITIGMLGIILEIRTPGFGVPGALGISSLALFFWGHWLVQLAGWEELLLGVGGIVLLLLEVLVIPGFGVAGLLGIGAIIASLVLSLVGAGDSAAFVVGAAGRVVLALVFALIASLVLLRFLPHLPFGRRLILKRGLLAAEGYASAPESDAQWLGKTGRATSPLRPAGIADIDGRRVDVVSDGEHIDAGQFIEVTRVDGNRVVVRRISDINQKE
jgi:membrane-bound serine protease (ClpP class)